MTPTRRLLLISAAALAASPALAQGLTPEDQALVDKAIAYLEGLAAAKGRFSQTDPRGKTATGDIFVQRPGKVRLAYDPPNDLLVVSNGNQVAIHNMKLNTYEAYPFRATPLALFLAKNVRLDRGVAVSNVTRTAGGFTLTAADRTRETPGSVTLVFSDNPVALREWTVIDAQRGKTRVVLSNLAPASGLSSALFTLPKDPRPRAPSRGG